MKTLVLGASLHSHRYSFKAINLLRAHHHEVIALGRDAGQVADVELVKDFPQNEKLDTITIYLNPERQKEYYDRIIQAKPRRIIFNPGAENPELEKLARENGIQTEEACTLVLLGTGQY